MMRKCFLHFAGAGFMLLSLMLFSCSSPSGSDQAEEVTLKSTADSLSERTEWTSEIDDHVLSDELPGVDGMERAVKVQPQTIILSSAVNQDGMVYPRIRTFSSLDISSLNAGALDTLNGFCSAMLDGSDAERFMRPERVYALALFCMDLRELTGEDNGTENPVFHDYILGEPFIAESFIQCPVRFFYDEEKEGQILYERPSLDIFLYLEFADGKWSVFQIDFF